MSFEMEVGLIVLAVMLLVTLIDILFEEQLERATWWVVDTTERVCVCIDEFFARADKRIDDFFDEFGW